MLVTYLAREEKNIFVPSFWHIHNTSNLIRGACWTENRNAFHSVESQMSIIFVLCSSPVSNILSGNDRNNEKKVNNKKKNTNNHGMERNGME